MLGTRPARRSAARAYYFDASMIVSTRTVWLGWAGFSEPAVNDRL